MIVPLIVMLLIGVALVSSSFIRTYRDINADTAIPINNYPDKLDETCYSVIISEKPQDISPEQGIYHDLPVGNDHIIAKHLNMKMIMRRLCTELTILTTVTTFSRNYRT